MSLALGMAGTPAQASEALDRAMAMPETVASLTALQEMAKTCAASASSRQTLQSAMDQLQDQVRKAGIAHKVPAARIQALLDNWTQAGVEMALSAAAGFDTKAICGFRWPLAEKEMRQHLPAEVSRLANNWGTQQDLAVVLETFSPAAN